MKNTYPPEPNNSQGKIQLKKKWIPVVVIANQMATISSGILLNILSSPLTSRSSMVQRTIQDLELKANLLSKNSEFANISAISDIMSKIYSRYFRLLFILPIHLRHLSYTRTRF